MIFCMKARLEAHRIRFIYRLAKVESLVKKDFRNTLKSTGQSKFKLDEADESGVSIWFITSDYNKNAVETITTGQVAHAC